VDILTNAKSRGGRCQILSRAIFSCHYRQCPAYHSHYSAPKSISILLRLNFFRGTLPPSHLSPYKVPQYRSPLPLPALEIWLNFSTSPYQRQICHRDKQLTHLYAYGVRGDHGASPRGCLNTPDGIRRVLDAHHTRRVVLMETLARTQVLHTQARQDGRVNASGPPEARRAARWPERIHMGNGTHHIAPITVQLPGSLTLYTKKGKYQAAQRIHSCHTLHHTGSREVAYTEPHRQKPPWYYPRVHHSHQETY
jgi:hypothetical protein